MKIKILAVFALSALIAMTGIAGCGDSGSAAGPGQFTDDLGRTVSLDATPEKIVSLSPSCTETIFALGLGNKLVGVTTYCNYPEGAASKPQVGDFTNPNLEAILAAAPDLVLATGGVQEEQLERMEDLGLTVFAVDPTTFDASVESIRVIGRLTGAAAKATEIADDMAARGKLIKDAVAEREGERPRVFYEIFYENGVWTAGSDSIVADLIRTAGGVNVGDAEPSDYYQFSVEGLMAEDPDVYFFGSGSMSNPGDITGRQGWDQMQAIAGGRVYMLEDDLVYRTGPRLIEGLEAVYRALVEED
ncbi:MAG: ABC transporter substrate-binding protein [Candidatus Geothermincolia bacterium]